METGDIFHVKVELPHTEHILFYWSQPSYLDIDLNGGYPGVAVPELAGECGG